MISPTIPKNEKQRLTALQALNILHTPPELCFDRITQFAMEELGVSGAAISFIDSDRQWFNSSIGLGYKQTAREIAICSHTILREGCFVVFDATQDPRFCDNPLVIKEQHIRFYAGIPLHSLDSQRIGSFCVINDRPMLFSAENFSRLHELAYMAEQEIEYRYHLIRAS